MSGTSLNAAVRALVLALPLSLSALAAHAHSPLSPTSPADKAMVAAAPDAIEMDFRGKARLIRLTLTGAGGDEVVLGKDHLMVEASHHRVGAD